MSERKNDGNNSAGEDKNGTPGPTPAVFTLFPQNLYTNDLFKGSLNLPLSCIEEVYEILYQKRAQTQ